jgi:DNA-binding NtrC family response regulator
MLEDIATAAGFEPVALASLSAARVALARRLPQLVLCDLTLPDGNGLELLEELPPQHRQVTILLACEATVESAVTALRLGASDYLVKPVDVARLRTLASRAADRSVERPADDTAALVERMRRPRGFGAMEGASAPMLRVYELLAKAAPTDAPVLIIGESGTGKELVAKTIHELSSRRFELFLPVNCGAISPALIESELFGHERGSFTGAIQQRKGYFELAAGGTLFLDEITEMPIALQVKLLRVLETSRVRRVGGEDLVDLDARIIAATNRDPRQAIQAGQLRGDLLYRLNVFPIHLPPLRTRTGDVALLAAAALAELNRREGRNVRFAPQTLELFESYAWPGNVRQLRNAIERAYIVAQEVIEPRDLPREITGDATPALSDGSQAGVPAKRRSSVRALRGGSAMRSVGGSSSCAVRVGSTLQEVERQLIQATLERLDGNRKRTAETLGISVKTLGNRLRRYHQSSPKQS